MRHEDKLSNTIEENDVYKRTTCRLCGSSHLEMVMPMPATPIADGYVPAERGPETQKHYPLDLYLCQDCGLVHLRDVVNPEFIYRNYLYETGTSPGLDTHFKKYADDVLGQIRPVRGNLVVELGSNDGMLLGSFRKRAYGFWGSIRRGRLPAEPLKPVLKPGRNFLHWN